MPKSELSTIRATYSRPCDKCAQTMVKCDKAPMIETFNRFETKPETHTKNSDLSIGTLSKLNGVDPAVFADKL